MKTIRYSLRLFFVLILSMPVVAQLRDVYAPPVGYSFYDVHAFDQQRVIVCGDRGTIVQTTSLFETWSIIETGTKATLRSIDFFSEQTGVVCGDSGRILRTTNGGLSWLQQTTSTQQTLHSLQCLSSTVAVCVGNEGVILRSTDAGATWSALASPTQTGLLACAFSKSGVGVAVGFFGTILRSTDNGQTWDNVPSDTRQSLFTVAWASETTCIVGGDSAMTLRSTTSGSSWGQRAYMYADQAKNYTTHRVLAIAFKDSSEAIVAGRFDGDFITFSAREQRLYRTTNGGKGWQWNNPSQQIPPNRDTIFPDPEDHMYRAMTFVNSTTGIAVGNAFFVAGVSITTDGGRTWRAVQNFHPNLHVIVSPDNPGWSDVRVPNIRGFCFKKNKLVGSVITMDGGIWQTIDGGQSLQDKKIITSNNITVTNSKEGTVVFLTDTSTVGVSTDYGTTWTVRDISSLGTAKRCFGTRAEVIDARTIRAYFYGILSSNIADRNYYIESNDAGVTWLRSTNVPPSWLDTTKNTSPSNNILFSTDTQCWAVGSERIQNQRIPFVFKSSDKGRSWDTLDMSATMVANDSYLDIMFSSPSIGIITGRNSTLNPDSTIRGMFYLRTTDGGTTWTRRDFRDIPEWHETTTQKPNVGFAYAYGKQQTLLMVLDATTYKKYFLSTNAGDTWKELRYTWDDTLGYFTNIHSLQTVYFHSADHLLLGLADLGIVEWRNSSTTNILDNDKKSGLLPTGTLQVRPLPVTNIMTVEVQSLQPVLSPTVRLLTIDGRECLLPMPPSSVQSSESVTFSFDCSHLADGMYILSVTEGRQTYIRPVIIAR